MFGHAGRRIAVAFVVASVVSLAAGDIAAADPGAVDESVVVNRAIELVIDVDEVSYGALDPGQTSAVVRIGATVSAPAGERWSIVVDGSAFTGPDASMPATIRGYRVGDGGRWRTLDGPTVLAKASAGESTTVSSQWRVRIPEDAAPGRYTGELRFTLRQP